MKLTFPFTIRQRQIRSRRALLKSGPDPTFAAWISRLFGFSRERFAARSSME